MPADKPTTEESLRKIEDGQARLEQGQAEISELLRKLTATAVRGSVSAPREAVAASPVDETTAPKESLQLPECTDFPNTVNALSGKFSFKICNPNSSGVVAKITIRGLTKDESQTLLAFTVNNGDSIRLNRGEQKEIQVALVVPPDYGRVSPTDIQMEKVHVSITTMPLPGDTTHQSTIDAFTEPMSISAGPEIMHAVRAPFDGETMYVEVSIDGSGPLAGLTFPPDKNSELIGADRKYVFCSGEKVDPASFRPDENIVIEKTLVGYNAQNVPVTVKLRLDVTPYFSTRAFVEKFISDFEKNVPPLKLESMFGFEIQRAIGRFRKAVFNDISTDQEPSSETIAKALADTLLQPIGMMLIRDYAQRWVRIDPGELPDRRGYEAIHRAIQEKLAVFNKFGNEKLDFFMSDLDADMEERTTQAVQGNQGNMRARTIRRDDVREALFVFWCVRLGTRNRETKRMREPAEVIVW